jgi:hypothetical protein
MSKTEPDLSALIDHLKTRSMSNQSDFLGWVIQRGLNFFAIHPNKIGQAFHELSSSFSIPVFGRPSLWQ